MIDRVGLINTGQAGGVGPQNRLPAGGTPVDPNAPSFKDLLLENLQKANQLQQDATTAIEDLQAGRRNDIETVFMATAQADTAFRMLLSVRTKVMDAYDEIKQIRV